MNLLSFVSGGYFAPTSTNQPVAPISDLTVEVVEEIDTTPALSVRVEPQPQDLADSISVRPEKLPSIQVR